MTREKSRLDSRGYQAGKQITATRARCRTNPFAVLLFTLVLLYACLCPAREEEPSPELLVKASFLLNFMRFTEWPTPVLHSAGQYLHLVVLGDVPLARMIRESLNGQRVNRQTVRVTIQPTLEAWQNTGRMPQALFVTEPMRRHWRKIAPTLVDQPVLTMADSPGFCSQNGMLNLFAQGATIRFEANPDAAKRASLFLSAQMLNLAVITATEEIP
ncbi:MAG: YfiR family protein [Desulfobulbus sp.]|jgi:hypothetical protein